MNVINSSIILIIFLNYGCAFTLDNKTSTSGIMFSKISQAEISHEHWKICYFYDLTEYFLQIDIIEQNMHQLINICVNIKNNSLCEKIIIQMQRHLEIIKGQYNLIHETNNNPKFRNKRSADFIGSIYNLFFGLLDADDAAKYDSEILDLQSNILEQKDLLKKQVLLIRGQIYTNNATLGKIKENLILVEKQINDLMISPNSTYWMREKFNDLFQLITVILFNNYKLTDSITDILTNSIQGKIMNVITIKMFKEHLKEIQDGIQINQHLPFDPKEDSIYDILKILKIKSALYNKRILIEIQVPVVENSEFTLYRNIPVPSLINKKLIILNMKNQFFLLDATNGKYIPMNQNDVNECAKYNNKLICSPNSPTYFNINEHCELSLFLDPEHSNILKKCNFKEIPHKNYFISIDEENKFFVYIDKPLTVRLICAGRKTEVILLKSGGILTLDKECSIKTDDLEINGKHSKNFGNILLNTPNLNLTEYIGSDYKYSGIKPKENIVFTNFENEFLNLDKEAEMILKNVEETTLKEFFSSRLNLYTGISFTTILLIFAIFMCVCFFYCKK